MMNASALALLLALAGPSTGLGVLPQDGDGPDLIDSLEKGYREAMKKASPAVVAILVDRVKEPSKKKPKPGFNPSTQRRMMVEDVFATRPHGAWTTGTIIESDGVILTTHFNVSGKVRSIKVRLGDGREFKGKVLGYNGTYDLAAIKIEAKDLPVIAPADLDRMQAGKTVLALGRAPDGKGMTINPGIVSASSRLGGRRVQTDAKLNFGNVGGPLVDTRGRLVAITCKVDVKYSATRGQNSGVGYAVPHDRLNTLIADLKEGRSVENPQRPFLGVQFKTESKITDGIELEAVVAGGGAERAGIKPGDVIVEIDGQRIRTFEELRAAILRRSAGDKISVKARRDGKTLEFECELGEADAIDR